MRDRRCGTVECNDSWNNEGPDYLLLGGCDTTGRGNFSADPLFCGPDDYSLGSGSPCAPASKAGCGRVGALDVGCAATPVRRASWGQLKLLYR